MFVCRKVCQNVRGGTGLLQCELAWWLEILPPSAASSRQAEVEMGSAQAPKVEGPLLGPEQHMSVTALSTEAAHLVQRSPAPSWAFSEAHPALSPPLMRSPEGNMQRDGEFFLLGLGITFRKWPLT